MLEELDEHCSCLHLRRGGLREIQR
jgi:hypothetical protein